MVKTVNNKIHRFKNNFTGIRETEKMINDEAASHRCMTPCDAGFGGRSM